LADIKLREDGIRTTGGPGTYEWWYFDTHLEDGSIMVIVFYTKPMFDVAGKLSPYANVTIDRPDGTHIEKDLYPQKDDFKFSDEKCDVIIGKNYFRGDLKKYQIHLEDDDLTVDVELTGTVPSWRPKTGYIYFGDNNEDYFAWLPSVPQGNVVTKIVQKNKEETIELTGIGYHDHNWGNQSMMSLMHHWYWGRCQIGEYTVISSYITAEKKYGYQEFPIFMIAKNGEILADNAPEYLNYTESNLQTDPTTGKPFYQTLTFDYNDPENHYKITYQQENTILQYKMIDGLSKPQKLAAKLAEFDGAYLRFSGASKLERIEDNQVVETVNSPAVWELMYFGKNI